MRRFNGNRSERYGMTDRVRLPEKVYRRKARRISDGDTDAEFGKDLFTAPTDPLGSWTGIPADGGKPVHDADDL